MNITLSEWWNQEAACELLQKARLNPEDSTPRIVLADWLEEHAQSFSNPFMEKLASVLRASFKRKTLRMIPKKEMSDNQPFVGALNGWFVGRESAYSGETSRLWLMAPDSFEIPKEIWLEMMPIKPGSFKMGSPPDEYDRSQDENLHEVILTKPFYIGKFPITQKQWRAVMGNDTGIGYSPYHPIESISFQEANDYCQRLNQILASKLNEKNSGCPLKLNGSMRAALAPAHPSVSETHATAPRQCAGAITTTAERTRLPKNQGPTPILWPPSAAFSPTITVDTTG